MMSLFTASESDRCGRRYWWGAVTIVVVLTLAIRAESFWTDELSSAFLAAQADWQTMIQQLGGLGSEAQMPLHVAWLWLWARIFGTGEWMLRAANIPWAILATVAWIGLLRRRSAGSWAMWLLVSPFLCYYMNEARPYMMSFATGMLSLLAVETLCAVPAGGRSSPGSIALVAGVGLCVGASMLNLVIVPALIAYSWVRLAGGGASNGGLVLARNHKGTLAGMVVLLACMAGYYLFTLMQGHGGQRDSCTWTNTAYACYEMLGFGGLGAARIMMRELSAAEVLSRYSITLVTGLMVWVGVVCAICNRWRDVARDLHVRAAFAGLVVGILSLAGAAVCFKVSLWGRHFMALFPLFLFGLVCSFESARKDSPLLVRLAICGLIGMFVVSSARQRMLHEYCKDPLREAVAELRALAGRSPSVPAVAITTPLALWRYAGDAEQAVIPVTAWSKTKATQWQKDHRQYLILVHRADKFDLQGLWSGQLTTSNADLLWRQDNIRIYLVHQSQ